MHDEITCMMRIRNSQSLNGGFFQSFWPKLTVIVLFNSGLLGFLFCLYHLILANKNWSQIEQLWSVLIRTLYIIRQKTKTRSKYVLIGHDLLQF